MQAKIIAFEQPLQELAGFAKLLSHPARISIIQLLAEKKSCISGDIALELPLSRATVCQHLQELKNAGLIKGEIQGLHVNYCLDTEKWKHIQSQFEKLFHNTTQYFNCHC